ncbi:hypothetical protein LguiA_013169 [Lonicera macranthoides]
MVIGGMPVSIDSCACFESLVQLRGGVESARRSGRKFQETVVNKSLGELYGFQGVDFDGCDLLNFVSSKSSGSGSGSGGEMRTAFGSSLLLMSQWKSSLELPIA